LGVIAAPAVPHLLVALRNPGHPRQRAAAADALRRMGPGAAASALPDLEAVAAGDEDPETRIAALRAISRIQANPSEKLRVLLAAWNAGDAAVHDAALRELSLARPVARLLDAVVPELQSGEPARRGRAAELLGALGPDASPAVPRIVEVLQSERPADRDALVRAVAAAGAEALDHVFNALEPVDPAILEEHHWAVSVLRRLEFDAIPRLVAALAHESPAVRAAALAGLESLAGEAEPAAGSITPSLEDPVAAVRARAWLAAASCGTD